MTDDAARQSRAKVSPTDRFQAVKRTGVAPAATATPPTARKTTK
jgi:hypothetical protein